MIGVITSLGPHILLKAISTEVPAVFCFDEYESMLVAYDQNAALPANVKITR
jgi:hypothetical protein